MKPLPPFSFLLLAASVLAMQPHCTPAAQSAADVIATDITNAVCSPLDPIDANPYVHFACTVAEAAEGIAATAITIQVPSAQAAAFAALHTADAVAKRKAAKK